VLGGISIAQYESTYNSNKGTYSDITDCPPDKPYFDNVNCVSCGEPFPYFNMYSKLCQTCGIGSTYNEKTKECEDGQGRMNIENPTIERMLSSIF
jgi:predicted amidophosphoribosyltransferase